MEGHTTEYAWHFPCLGSAESRCHALTEKRRSHQNKASKKKGEANMMKFIKDESGATAIEYGLLAALISIAALAAMKVVGTKLSTTFSTVGASMS